MRRTGLAQPTLSNRRPCWRVSSLIPEAFHHGTRDVPAHTMDTGMPASTMRASGSTVGPRKISIRIVNRAIHGAAGTPIRRITAMNDAGPAQHSGETVFDESVGDARARGTAGQLKSRACLVIGAGILDRVKSFMRSPDLLSRPNLSVRRFAELLTRSPIPNSGFSKSRRR